MLYKEKFILKENVWNNALSFFERQKILGKNPEIVIPKRIIGNINDVKTSENLVFEEVENGKIFSCFGLENFVEISEPSLPKIIIFDNHNHALFFWCEAISEGILEENFELLHMDQHSDLWENNFKISESKNLEKMWEFTNFQCNVGNYILPAMDAWIVWKIIRMENEFQIDENLNYTPSKNSVLNLDLDIFNLDYIDEKKIKKCIKNLLKKVKYATICTSPYFIEQWIAIQKLKEILSDET